MIDTCTTDKDCKRIKNEKDKPYYENFLGRSPKLCLGNNSYINVGGKYKKSKKHRQSKKHKKLKNSKKSKKSIKKSKRKKKKSRRRR